MLAFVAFIRNSYSYLWALACLLHCKRFPSVLMTFLYSLAVFSISKFITLLYHTYSWISATQLYFFLFAPNFISLFTPCFFILSFFCLAFFTFHTSILVAIFSFLVHNHIESHIFNSRKIVLKVSSHSTKHINYIQWNTEKRFK